LDAPAIVGSGFVSHDDLTWLPGNNPFTLPAFRLTTVSAVPDVGATIFLLAGSAPALLLLRRFVAKRQA
jgi:hypothetical protein